LLIPKKGARQSPEAIGYDAVDVKVFQYSSVGDGLNFKQD